MRNYGFWHRIKCAFWEDETAQAERVIGVLGMLRGAWMLNPYWNSIPPEVQGNLIPSSFTEYQWGTLLFLVCFLQIVVAGKRETRMRAMVATGVAVIQGAAAIGYWKADLFFRGVVPFILTMALVELWVAWRARNDRRIARYLKDRRSGFAI